MTPVRSAALDGEEGDCFRCCIAAIMNLPAEEVPHFTQLYDDDWERHDAVANWLAQYGMAMGGGPMVADSPQGVFDTLKFVGPGCPAIVSGLHKNGNGHSVVAMDGIEYDMTASGLAGPRLDEETGNHVYWIAYISAGPNFKPRRLTDA